MPFSENTTDFPQVTNKLSHISLHQVTVATVKLTQTIHSDTRYNKCYINIITSMETHKYNKIILIINKVGYVMVFNATFNNISVISWWSDLLVEETTVPRENQKILSVSDHQIILL